MDYKTENDSENEMNIFLKIQFIAKLHSFHSYSHKPMRVSNNLFELFMEPQQKRRNFDCQILHENIETDLFFF